MSIRSGSTTSSAPSAAAARVSRSASARLRSLSSVDCSWTAAARISPSPSLTDQSIWSVLRGHAGTPRARPSRARARPAASPGAHAAPPGRAPAEALALHRRVRAGADAVRRGRPRGRAAPALVGAGTARRHAARADDRAPGGPGAYARVGAGGRRDVRIELTLDESAGVEVVSPHGDA